MQPSRKCNSTCWLALLAILLVTVTAGHAHGQSTVDAQSGGVPATEAPNVGEALSLEDRRAAVAKQRQALQSRIDAASSDATPNGMHESMQWQLEALKYLELLYAQHEGVEQRKSELRDEKKALTAELDLLRSAGPPESKPYSFLLVDELQDELSVEAGRVETVREEIAAAQRLLATVQEKYDDAESQRRQAQEKCDAEGDAQQKRPLLARLEMAKLQSRVLAEALRVRKLEVEAARQKQELTQIRHQLLQEKLEVMSEDIVFSAADLAARLAALDQDEKRVHQDLADAQTELIEAERRWLDAKARHEKSGGGAAGAEEELEARQLDRDLQLETISLLNQRLALIALENLVWDLRYRTVNGLIPTDQFPSELSDLNGYRDRQKQTRALLEIRVHDLRLELSALDKRHRNARQEDAASTRWLEHQLERIQRLIGVIATNLVRQDATGRLLEKTAGDLGELSTDATPAGQLARLSRLGRACWDYEIAAVDDRPITVGKLILGVVFLLVGYAISRLLSRSVGRRVFARLGLTPGAASALQTISFYLMLTVFGFLSLELANVPLTVFTFLGGAVAIGVGFGSQNLMNNFISGLILLAERPVRVGDLVDIDGVNGTVENIGARSTRVRSGSNLEILVPNSTFLENRVTNWTLSNTQIRISVAVGVAYGSPTRQVTQLLRQTVTENADVLPDPEPLILFKEFGDNSLNFEVHFWVHMRTLMDGERIASEVRHTIDDLFREANITIAYPQRDVHLDTVKPIEVNFRQFTDDQLPAFGNRDAA